MSNMWRKIQNVKSLKKIRVGAWGFTSRNARHLSSSWTISATNYQHQNFNFFKPLISFRNIFPNIVSCFGSVGGSVPISWCLLENRLIGVQTTLPCDRAFVKNFCVNIFSTFCSVFGYVREEQLRPHINFTNCAVLAKRRIDEHYHSFKIPSV